MSPTDLTLLLQLIKDNGLPIVMAVLLTAVVGWMYRQNQKMWSDRLAEQKTASDKALADQKSSCDAQVTALKDAFDRRLADVEARRVEERQEKLDAEARLASNADTLREATSAFNQAQQLMERFVERIEPGQPTGRRGGGSGR